MIYDLLNILSKNTHSVGQMSITDRSLKGPPPIMSFKGSKLPLGMKSTVDQARHPRPDPKGSPGICLLLSRVSRHILWLKCQFYR